MLLLRFLLAALASNIGLALTPVGNRPSGGQIFVAPHGSRAKQVDHNMEIFAPNGTLIHTFVNVMPGSASATKERRSLFAARQSLSAAQASTTVIADPANVIEAYNTSFTVPALPKTFESQIIYLSATVVASNQGVEFAWYRCVLQYGANAFWGGPFWTISTELELGPDGSLLVVVGEDFNPRVEVGATIQTSILHKDEGDDIFWYEATFNDQPTALEVGWHTPVGKVVIGLEEEGVTQPSEYPPEPFTFKDTNLTMTRGAPEVAWDVPGDSTTGAFVTVDVDGAVNAELTVHFLN
ncbi:hypothetical protein R3P38DRAFT_3449921 [Favolaschia claudopus]|uniref:Uncharacterized protein n=1 Tax=Favolaschia claudopus TaxID=2862362 RepID=A0AAV9ZNS8_9AGAR